MTGSDAQKKETLAVVRGGRYAQRPMRVFTTLELRLDAEMQEVLGAVRGADGKPPTRGFQRVTYGEAFPWRVLARVGPPNSLAQGCLRKPPLLPQRAHATTKPVDWFGRRIALKFPIDRAQLSIILDLQVFDGRNCPVYRVPRGTGAGS